VIEIIVEKALVIEIRFRRITFVNQIFAMLHVGAAGKQVRIQGGLFPYLYGTFQLSALVNVVQRREWDGDMVCEQVFQGVSDDRSWNIAELACVVGAKCWHLDIRAAVGAPDRQGLAEVFVAGRHAHVLCRVPDSENADGGIDQETESALQSV